MPAPQTRRSFASRFFASFVGGSFVAAGAAAAAAPEDLPTPPAPTSRSVNPLLAEIIMFGGNFAPRGWAFCDGQLLAISQNQALFSILGTTYGGDGRTTFGLPDLRGRVPMHAGNGPGLTSRRLGEKTGSESHTLSTSNLPSHTHTATVNASSAEGSTDTPATNTYWAKNVTEGRVPVDQSYSTSSPDVTMASDAVTLANTGAGAAVNNVQPVQCVNFIIALIGVFPSRN